MLTTHETWGIPGHTFLAVFVGLEIAALVWGLTKVIGMRRRGGDAPVESLSAVETGMLVSGRNAVLAALTQLRDIGLIDTSGRPVRAFTTADTSAVDPFARTVFDTLSAAPGRLGQRLTPALATLENDLIVRNYLVSRRPLGAALPMVAVLVLGLLRLIAGLYNHRPVGYLILALVAGGCAALFLARGAGRLTRRGSAALEAARRRYRHLDPRLRPARSVYGGPATTFGVALFGVGLMTWFDPVFAASASASSGYLGGTLQASCGSAAASGGAFFGGGGSCGGGGSSCGGGSSGCGGGGGCGG